MASTKNGTSVSGRGRGRPRKNGRFVATGPKKKVKSTPGTFKRFIHKVLKQVHPNLGISQKAMSIMESFCHVILRESPPKLLDLLVTTEKQLFNHVIFKQL